jgi:hypothetical protein
MKTARKDFPLAVVLTLVTDVLMHLPIEDVFTCASHVIGYPIAQHELSDHRTAIKKAIFAQHPELADLAHVKAGRRDAATYLPKYVERQIAKFGKTVSLAHGKAKRTEDPIDSLRRRAPHMGVIIAADDKPRRPKHA